MLAPSGSQSSLSLSLQEVPIDISEDELASRRSTMQVFKSQAVEARARDRGGASGTGLHASDYPDSGPIHLEPDTMAGEDPPRPDEARLEGLRRRDEQARDRRDSPIREAADGGSGSELSAHDHVRARPAVAADEAERTSTEEPGPEPVIVQGANELDDEQRREEVEDAAGQRPQQATEATIQAGLAAEQEKADAARISEQRRREEEATAGEPAPSAAPANGADPAEEADTENLRLEQSRQEELEREELEQIEARRREVAERQARLVAAREAGDVMLSGSVNVQAADSVLWKRRFYELAGGSLRLYKSHEEPDEILSEIATVDIEDLTTDPEEALVPHSFSLRLRHGDGYLFYHNTAEETKLLVEALRCDMRI
ncbi:hypothetical protein JCM8202v2_000444 [Rhodotorula sphaerocarpa]